MSKSEDSVGLDGQSLTAPRTLVYQVRAADVEVTLTPVQEGARLTLTGSLKTREGGPLGYEVLVELLDALGFLASVSTLDEFVFPQLPAGSYNLRLTGAEWKLGVVGITG